MNKGIFLSLLVEFITKFSNYCVHTVIMLIVLSHSKYTIELGYVNTAMIFPALVFTFFSNRIFFRLGHWRLIHYALISRAVLLVIVGLLSTSILSMFVLSACSSVLQQCISTAKLTYDTVLITNTMRAKFNSYRALIGSLSMILGPSIGGVLTSFLGGNIVLIAIGMLTLVTAFILPKPESSIVIRKNNVSKDGKVHFMSSIKFLNNHKIMLILVVIYVLVATILAMETPLIFPFTQQVYGGEGEIAGTLLGACGVGALFSALILKYRPQIVKPWVIMPLVIIDGICLLLFAYSLPLIAAYVVFGLLGIMGTLIFINVETMIQNDVPRSFQPAIFSMLQFSGHVGGAGLTMLSTALSDAFGVALVLKSAAILEIFFGFSCIIFFFKTHIIK